MRERVREVRTSVGLSSFGRALRVRRRVLAALHARVPRRTEDAEVAVRAVAGANLRGQVELRLFALDPTAPLKDGPQDSLQAPH